MPCIYHSDAHRKHKNRCSKRSADKFDHIAETESGLVWIESGRFYRGAGLAMSKDAAYMKVFCDSIKKLYKGLQGKGHKYLGYIFQLLPYVNREHNILCWNPEEKEKCSIQRMDLLDVCGLVGFDTKHIDRLFNILASQKFVFVSIALLVIITTMKRMITQQRTQIGTLNALGIVLGVLTFGRMMVDMFSQFYTLPDWQPGFNYKSIAVAAVLVMICTGTSYLSCKKILKIQPSEALRPAAAKTAKPCIFEKLPFWDKLSFNVRYNLRDISRSKMRAFMGVFGTCMGMMIMELGLGAYDTVDYVRGWYFRDIQNYAYQVILNDSCTPEQAEEMKTETDGELVAMDAISIAAKDHPTSDDIISCKLAVTEGEQLYCVSDLELNTKPIPEGTVALTMKQAKKLGLSEGDNVFWKTATGSEWNESKIGLISRHPNITGITMLREDYEAAGMTFRPVMLVSKNDCESLAEKDCVSAVHSMTDLIAAFDKMMEIMNLLVYFMVVFAILLIVIVLYNSGNLSFNEREKEFATLKVLGFKSSAIRKLLSTQNLWLSVLGVICGLPLGRVPLQAMMDSNGDAVDWPCCIAPSTYLIAAVFVMTVSVLVSFLFSRRIRKIDMVEVLKGME